MATTTAALECLPTCSSDRALEPNSELWTRLKSFQFCNGLCSRVASENQWSLEYTTQVLEEYRKLIYLLAAVDENLVASREIEEAWRVHLLYSHSYIIDLGMGVLGTVLHHDCDDGSQRNARCPNVLRGRWQLTVESLANHRQQFGQSLTGSVIPGANRLLHNWRTPSQPHPRFSLVSGSRFNTSHYGRQ